MSDYSNLQQGAAVVIGGSGAIGATICKALAQVGSNVAISYHSNAEKAQTVAAEVDKCLQQSMIGAVDLTDINSIQTFLAAVEKKFGTINTVVYAAGPHVVFAAIADQDPEKFKSVMEQDVVGYFNLLHEAIPYLRKSKGSVVALTTAGTRRYVTKDILSIAPKGAVEQLTKGVAREEGRSGIRANIVGTGWIDAGLGKEVIEESNVGGLFDKFVKGLPLRRVGQAEEVAAAVLYLASNDAAYVSGNFIDVDGGGCI